VSAEARQETADELSALVSQLRDIISAVSVCCSAPGHDDEEWPANYPAAPDFGEHYGNLFRAVRGLQSAVARTKKNYRQDVLQWLLAETEAS
jgi:hypothetical protein